MSTLNYNPIPARPKRPLGERFNLRLIGFIAIFAVLLGVPFYLYVDAALSGGVKDKGDYYDVDLKAMSTFPFDQQNGRLEDVPARWRALDGKTIVMRGEVAPGSTSATGVDQKFDLVYSVAKCCFTGEPQIQHFIKVTVPPDAKMNVTTGGALQVKGVLKVDVVRDPELNKVTAVYHVNASELESL
jgi:hypothetical protein